ncbi:MAG: hypothetical protein JWN86_4214 [Planctomycetota bacterium]|nr:hypothetical protein [Planctomycetota bacterium]
MADGPRTSSRLDPSVSWTVMSDAPLLGLSYAREAGLMLAWDDASHVYLLDGSGDRRYESRAPEKIISAAMSDDGTLVALLLAKSRLVLLGPELEPIAERSAPSDATNLTVDSHGRFVAIGTKSTETSLFTRHGKPSVKIETRQPLAHLRFVPGAPMLIGAATFGVLVGIELAEVRLSGGLDAEVVWEEKVGATIGRIACSGDGNMILASCFTHGVQRYDLRGQNEGSYHLGGTAALAVPDFAGRSFVVATTEGELSLLNPAGNVRWKTKLSRAPVGLEFDALGRHLYYGLPTGEICRIDLDGSAPRATTHSPKPGASSVGKARSASVRAPDWTLLMAQNDDQSQTAVLAVLDEPPLIAVYTNSNHPTILSLDGETLCEGPDCPGVGRILRTSPGWIAAATDRNLVLYEARRNTAKRLDLNLIALTHLVIRPDTFGLGIIQERDRLGRATPSGRWIWRQELRSPVEDMAVGAGNLIAVTTDSGHLSIYDGAGEPAGRYEANPPEPLCLVEAPESSPAGVAWITLARRNQILRGHTIDGRVVWESPVPWEGWQLIRMAARVVVAAPDGKALSYDGSGHLRAQTRADESPGDFFPGSDGEPLRISKQGVNLICADLGGRVRWRSVAEVAIGAWGTSASGVAVMLGRDLAWFGPPGRA